MMSFPEWFRIPLGDWVDVFVEWLVREFGSVFDSITTGVLYVLVRLERFLLWVPWWALEALLAYLAWRATRRWQVTAATQVQLVLIGAFGLWPLAMSTLAIILVSTIISIVLGIPTGILMARSDLARSMMRPALDAMQTMPSFVYLIPAMMLFGLGKVPAIFATVIYAVPPVIRLTDLGIRQVDAAVVEAAEAFGSSRRQILYGVQLPLALPTIMAGINQTLMMALAMVVIASMIGARGLGEQVLLGIQRLEIGRGFEAGLSIVALAIVIDRITQGYARSHARYARAGQ